jgi:hypothetical protein
LLRYDLHGFGGSRAISELPFIHTVDLAEPHVHQPEYVLTI